MTRKLMKIFMTLCLTLTMILGSSMMTMAADEAESVTITSIPVAAFGEKIIGEEVGYEGGAGCVVETVWKIWDAEEETYLPVTDENAVFDESSVYMLNVAVTPEEGYVFGEDFMLEVSENLGLDYGVWGSGEGDAVEVWECDFSAFSFGMEIMSIEIELPNVEAGVMSAVNNVTLKTNDEAIDNDHLADAIGYYEPVWQQVYPYDDAFSIGDNFEDGNAYQFMVDMKPNDGYWFSESVEVYINGELVESGFATPTSISYFKDYTLVEPIKSLEVSGIPEVVAGEEITVDDIQFVTDREDVELFAYWYDEEGNEVIGETFEEGKSYVLSIEVNAFGYAPLIEPFVFVIDGEEYKATSQEYEYQQAWLELTYEAGAASAAESEETGSSAMIWGVVAVVAVIAVAGAAFAVKKRSGK